MNRVAAGAREVGAVLVHAVRILATHWPVLISIYLIGAAVRNGALWAAVVVSGYQPTLGAFLVPLAPLAMLIAVILMLRAVAPSLHSAALDSGIDPQTYPRRRDRARLLIGDRLSLLAATLVPFLTVYAAQGHLAQDRYKWINEANADELQNNADLWFRGVASDVGRTLIADDLWLWIIVLVAIGVRTAIDKLELAQRHTAWGLGAAWVEVTWLTLLVGQIARFFRALTEWLDTRVVVVWARDLWAGLTGALGGFGAWLEGVRAWLWSLTAELDTVILVPMAWLTVAAIVYSRRVSTPELNALRHERVARLATRLRAVPTPVRRWGSELLADLFDRFAGLVGGVRTLATAGLAPMLLFCLAFVGAAQVEFLVYEGLRLLVGPRSWLDSSAFFPYAEVLGMGGYLVVLTALLAAAVDRVIGRQPDPATQAEEATA